MRLRTQKGSFSFSRNCSSANGSTHKFFNPSYIPPKDLVRLDEIGFKSNNNNSHTNNKKSIFKYVAPALSVAKNYGFCDNNNINNNENSFNNKNLNLKQNINNLLNDLNNLHITNTNNSVKATFNNKNSHLNISIDSINNNNTILNIRRANSNNIKQISISNSLAFTLLKNNQKRSFSTEHKIEELKESKEVKEDLKEDIKDVKEHIDNATVHINTNPVNSDNNIDNILEPFLYKEDPVTTQLYIINNFLNLNKYNEILPVFNRMRNNQIIPNLEIYHKVLKSIVLRNIDESLEIKLTHLLNVYSDMLTNNLKPNNEIYELIINELVNSSIKSYNSKNYKIGYEFFKISFDLFLIFEKNNINSSFINNEIYINLIKSLNYYKIKNLINSNELYNMLKDKINESNKSNFLIQIIKFSTLFNDIKFIEELYNNEIKGNNSNSPGTKANKNNNNNNNNNNIDLIYQSIIESYNLCNEFDKSSLMLDTIINNLPNKLNDETQYLINQYLSIYIQSLSLKNPNLSIKMIEKFSKFDWLPNLNIKSLILLSNSFINSNNLTMAMKIWDFIIIRKDFNSQFLPIILNTDGNGKEESDYYSIYLSNYLSNYLQLIINSNNKNLIFKTIREILNLDSILLNDQIIINLINYLKVNEINDNNNIILKLILNQGYKRIIYKENLKKMEINYSINNYLSMIIDFLPTKEYFKLFKSEFFKKVIEEYRLINDNIYGILKIFQNLIPKIEMIRKSDDEYLKLEYYSKVLNYEFNDVDNTYVEIPNEINEFKGKIKQFI